MKYDKHVKIKFGIILIWKLLKYLVKLKHLTNLLSKI